MNREVTRRRFLSRLTAGFTLLAGGCAQKQLWTARGSEQGAVRLVFYTDVHARTEWDTPTAMEQATHAINAQHADLVIAGGDLITEGFESTATKVAPRWDAYMKMHRTIAADLYPTLGNHDLVAADPEDGSPPSENPRAAYLEKMGLHQTYYSFDAMGYHFVILDSIEITGDELRYRGYIGPEEMEWLKADLASLPKNTPIIIATHLPLLTSFFAAIEGAMAAAPKNRVIVNNRDVLKVFQDHNVILVLQGHMHVHESIRWRNITFISGGAICGKWWRGSWYGTPEGFTRITLAGNKIQTEYITYGWKARRL